MIDLAGTVENVAAQELTGDTDCRVRSLFADVTNNGQVNLGDRLAIQVKVDGGQTAAALPEFDIDLSGGNIDANDMLAAKARVSYPAHQALCP